MRAMMQQDDNQKNLLLAIVLSVAVLLGWQVFYAGPKMEQERARQQQVQRTTQQAPSQGVPGQAPGVGAPPLPGAAQSGVVAVTREAALKAAPRVAIETPSLKGSISLKEARHNRSTDRRRSGQGRRERRLFRSRNSSIWSTSGSARTSTRPTSSSLIRSSRPR